MIWPVSWPLPAITSTSPASSAAIAGADGLGPVADFLRARAAGQDFLADGGRIFAARIVVGDDDVVGERAGALAHQRALALVAVAAAAEHDMQLVLRHAGGCAVSTVSSASGVWA